MQDISIILGKNPLTDERITYDGFGNVLLIGNHLSGKTTGAIIPTLCTYKDNAIIFDDVSEETKITIKARSEWSDIKELRASENPIALLDKVHTLVSLLADENIRPQTIYVTMDIPSEDIRWLILTALRDAISLHQEVTKETLVIVNDLKSMEIPLSLMATAHSFMGNSRLLCSLPHPSEKEFPEEYVSFYSRFSCAVEFLASENQPYEVLISQLGKPDIAADSILCYRDYPWKNLISI